MTPAEIAVGVLILLSGFLSMAAGIGIVRFPDVLTRLHAATKPQTLGLLLVLAGVAMRLHSGMDLATLLLVGFFQLLTSPVAAHLVARSAYRTGQIDHGELLVDELDQQLTAEAEDVP